MFGSKKEKKRKLPEITIDNRKINKHVRKIEGVTVKHAQKFLIKRWSNILEVKRQVVAWILIMATLVLATGLQLLWTSKNYTDIAPIKNSTYAEAVLGPVDTLNPLFANSQAEKSADYLLFSRILSYDTSGKLNYDLASNLTVDKTGKIYKVTIRPDVKWHDGESLTTKDIAFTVNLIKNEDIHSNISGWNNVSIKIIDDYSIEFILKSVYAPFKHSLNFPILPEHILKDVVATDLRESNFSQNPVGSGPFKINFIQKVDTQNNQKVVVLSRNNDYYKGRASLSTLQLYVYEKPEQVINSLFKKEVNAATGFTMSDASDDNFDNYNVISQPIQSGVYAIINTASSILSNKNVRKALQLATDTSEIKEKISNQAPDLYMPLTTSQLTGSAPVKPKYNLETAKKLLDSSGWKLNKDGIRQKSGKELKINLVTIKSSEFEKVLDTLSSQWRLLGVVVETNIIDPEDVNQNFTQTILQPRNYDVLLYKLDIGADPDMYAYWHSSQISNTGLNLANYSSSISDDALVSARDRLDSKLRNAKYLTFVKQWLSDVPAIGLYQSTMEYAYRKNTYTFSPNSNLIYPVDRYANVLDWASGSQVIYKTP